MTRARTLSKIGSDPAIFPGNVNITGGVLTAYSAISAEFAGSVKIGGTAAANEIDEYEEGTWTPAINDGAGNDGSLLAVACRYTKIGRLVHVRGSLLNMVTTGLTSTNTLYITGLPFTLQPNTANSGMGFPVGTNDITTTKGAIAHLSYNTATLNLYEIDDAFGPSGALQVSAFNTSADVILSITYETA